jgi:hypothetical protein
MSVGVRVAALIVFVLAGNLLTLAVLFLLVSGIFATLSGWGRLAAAWRRPPAVDPGPLSRASISVGPVRYYRCARLAVRPEGLCLAIVVLRLHPPLCIPWREFRRFEPVTVFRQPGMRLSAGDPERGTVILPMDVYRQAYPYLAEVSRHRN